MGEGAEVILRRALLTALFLYSASLAASHYYGGYDWTVSKRPPLVPQWHTVGSMDVQVNCRDGKTGWWFNGCAVYDVKGGVCHIYASQSETETPEWLRWHEFLHCAGWDHN